MTNLAAAYDQPDTAEISGPDEKTENECCPHPESAHDAVAKRFCAATLRGALKRGCICHGDTSAQRFR